MITEWPRHLLVLASRHNGIRSTGWNFDDNVKKAIDDNHPQPKFLKMLAKVISDEMKESQLEEFETWQQIT